MADDTDETQRTFLELGSHVQVRAAGSAEAYFGGTVACTYDDGSFDVEYDDGLYESRVPQQRLQGSQHEATTEPRAVRRHTFAARKPWPAPKKPMDAAVVTRTDKGFVAWRTEPAPKGRAEVRAEPTDKGAADGPVELRASAIAAAARAVLPRRDRGVYAWGTSDRGLAPAAKAPLVDDGGDTPQSLRGALRPHVAGFAFNAPEYGPLTASFASDVDIPDDFLLTGLVKRKPDGKLGPGAYDARWDVAKPRALGHAMVAESTAQLRPQAQLALARRRGVDGAPGEYDVNDDYNSRFARKPTATIAAERAHEARRRRADVEADVEALARLARKKLRAAARRDRALREKEREADAKFKAWRAKKLGGDFDQLFASDSSDGFDEAALASSDDGGTPLSLTRATRRSRRHTTINPERAQLPAALANRRAHEETLEAQRGPAAYDVRRSMAVTEKGVVTAATFGAEREARERREQDSKAQTKLAFKRAAEHAAEEARSKLLGPQLLFNWVSPADGDGEANEYSRFARSSKAVFRYVPKAATPERVRDARLLAEAARAARDAAPSPKYVDADDDVLDIGKGPGRDVTEVLRKGLSLWDALLESTVGGLFWEAFDIRICRGCPPDVDAQAWCACRILVRLGRSLCARQSRRTTTPTPRALFCSPTKGARRPPSPRLSGTSASVPLASGRRRTATATTLATCSCSTLKYQWASLDAVSRFQGPPTRQEGPTTRLRATSSTSHSTSIPWPSGPRGATATCASQRATNASRPRPPTSRKTSYGCLRRGRGRSWSGLKPAPRSARRCASPTTPRRPGRR
mmetsp:Transcript_32303/g.111198  ORF Transcript_32303/g.111198 Transcript_32303/m.111198 type:complete len:808 (+) Transcript_32303:695-3118(+)